MKYYINIVEIFLSRITRQTKEKMIRLNYMRQKATNPIFFVISQLTNINHMTSITFCRWESPFWTLETCFEAFDFHVDQSCINLGQPINIDRMTTEYSQLHILHCLKQESQEILKLGRYFSCNRQFKFWQSIIWLLYFYILYNVL